MMPSASVPATIDRRLEVVREGQGDKGAPITFSGLATHVLQKQADGGYKLKLHTFN